MAGRRQPAEPVSTTLSTPADADSALDLCATAPADADDACCIVGHNPTAASLAHLLDDGDPRPRSPSAP